MNEVWGKKTIVLPNTVLNMTKAIVNGYNDRAETAFSVVEHRTKCMAHQFGIVLETKIGLMYVRNMKSQISQ